MKFIYIKKKNQSRYSRERAVKTLSKINQTKDKKKKRYC